jgi:hypothetical protein
MKQGAQTLHQKRHHLFGLRVVHIKHFGVFGVRIVVLWRATPALRRRVSGTRRRRRRVGVSVRGGHVSGHVRMRVAVRLGGGRGVGAASGGGGRMSSAAATGCVAVAMVA